MRRTRIDKKRLNNPTVKDISGYTTLHISSTRRQ